MTRNIDFSKPLDEDEQRYVADRPWLLTDARLRGEDIILEDDGDTDTDDDDTSISDESANGEGSTDNSDDSDDGDDDESDDSDEDADEDEGEEDEVPPYAEWEYAALKEEAKRRDLNAGGSKEQLITRLEQDDASAPE